MHVPYQVSVRVNAGVRAKVRVCEGGRCVLQCRVRVRVRVRAIGPTSHDDHVDVTLGQLLEHVQGIFLVADADLSMKWDWLM